MGSILSRLRRYGEFLMFGHSVFSLPFALAAMLLASGGRPGWKTAILVCAAFLGARNAANALNRLIDSKLDAANPRTAGRHLPSGQISRLEALALTAFFGALFLGAVLFLPRICLYLSPIALFLIFAYSYTKRFTWLCHLVLGIASAAASVGGWLAVTGSFDWPVLLLASANAAWVCGFDIIYQGLDAAWDREHKLHSIPADFGPLAAETLSALCHAGSVLFFILFGAALGRGPSYFIGIAGISLLLGLEQMAAKPKPERPKSGMPKDEIPQGNPNQGRILFSAYTMNQIIGPAFLIVVVLDMLVSGAWL